MSKITVPLGRLRRKSPLHPQPIVNSLCSKLRQATAHAKESVEFTEKNTDLPAVDGQQVSRCAQIGSPAQSRAQRLHRLQPPPTPGREELNQKPSSAAHERKEARSTAASSE